jgi:hypothetical protein
MWAARTNLEGVECGGVGGFIIPARCAGVGPQAQQVIQGEVRSGARSHVHVASIRGASLDALGFLWQPQGISQQCDALSRNLQHFRLHYRFQGASRCLKGGLVLQERDRT